MAVVERHGNPTLFEIALLVAGAAAAFGLLRLIKYERPGGRETSRRSVRPRTSSAPVRFSWLRQRDAAAG